MQRAAHFFRRALAVHCASDGQGVGIEFDDRIEARATLVNGIDAGQVARHQRVGAELAGGHLRLLFQHAGVEDAVGRAAGAIAGSTGSSGNSGGRSARCSGCGQANSNKVPAIHAISNCEFTTFHGSIAAPASAVKNSG